MAGSEAIVRSGGVQVQAPPRLDANPALTPFLKWPGGKTQELAAIAAAAPALTGRFIDPFVGGGAMLFATPSEVPALANDACRDLVELYTSAASGDEAFRRAVDGMAATWDGLAHLDPLYAELGAAFSHAIPGEVGAALEGHARTLRRLLAEAGPGLTPSFDGRAVGEITTKLARMREG